MSRVSWQIIRKNQKCESIWKRHKEPADEGSQLMKIGIFMFILFLVFVIDIAAANAEDYKVGFVTTTNCSLRVEPSGNAQAIAKLKNGEIVVIMGEEFNYNEQETFYKVIRRSSWEEGIRYFEGYVLKDYIKVGEKYWITVPQSLKFSCSPGSTVKVGQRSKDKAMIVLDELTTYDPNANSYVYWWVLQMQDNYGGAAFIEKNSVSAPWILPEDQQFYQTVYGYTSQEVLGLQNPEQQPVEPSQPEQQVQQQEQPSQSSINGLYNEGNATVIRDGAEVRSRPDDNANVVAYLNNGDIVKICKVGDYFTQIYFNYKGVTVNVYVHTADLQGI